MRASAITAAGAAAALIITSVASVAFAQAEEEVLISKQAVLLLKILKFDRALTHRTFGNATIAILYLEGNPESEAVRVEMGAALEAARKNVSFPLPIKVTRIAYSSAKLEAELANARPTAVYICPGLAAEVEAISRATRKQRTLTFTAQEPYVRAGLAVGLVARDEKPTILINLPAAKAEGADLSSALLRLSEVIR